MNHFFWIGWLSLCLAGLSGCSFGPSATGVAAEETLYLVSHDKIQLDNGTIVYVDSDGMLQGIPNVRMVAAGRKVGSVMRDVTRYVQFEKYKMVDYGRRYVDVAGEITPEKREIDYPPYEDWSVTNLVSHIQGFIHTRKAKEYLLVRKAWHFPGSHVFVRGITETVAEEMEADELLIFSGDKILFPGDSGILYVFGAVARPTCFLFPKGRAPNLKNAIEQADGLLKSANLENVQVYRLLNKNKRSIFTLRWEISQEMPLQSWDIVYVPFAAPQQKPSTEPSAK